MIVTRFAPSPTGFMHIGGVRTALFAYLLARKNGGQFILRIEDTDKEREVAGSIEHIQESLSWLGIEWDFGPKNPGKFSSCIQSERLDIYKKYALELIKKGYAYPDPYTEEQIAEFRKKAELEKRPFLYREHRPSEELIKAPWDGTKPLRLKTPEIKRYKWNDAVRGPLEAGPEALDDFILIKADGYPTYNFAHIVDDHEMGVTHILRGEEFISSTPKYLSLYEALGFIVPILATLPPILRDDKTKKLGKRDGAKDILEYRNEGYLPEAMVNTLALIGWNPGTDQEIFSMKQLIENFDLSKVQRSGGTFNEDKLDWYNHEYIKTLSDDELIKRLEPYLLIIANNFSQEINKLLPKTLPLIREKIIRLSDAPKLFIGEGELSFINDLVDYPAEKLLWKKNPDTKKTLEHLTQVKNLIQSIPDNTINSSNSENNFTADQIKNTIWSYVEANGKGDVLWPLRVAVTGKDKSPDPFVSASLIGKNETLKRINLAIDKLYK